MVKADRYIKETIVQILDSGCWDKNPRAKWKDGTLAHSKFISQKVFEYDIEKGEFPINTLRTTALKGAFYDIEAIYIKQTNILEDMHPSIQPWWKDFVVATENEKQYSNRFSLGYLHWLNSNPKKRVSHLGNTYGQTVKRYDLMNKLLKSLEENPFGRRHSMNLNQEQQKIDCPNALQPCAFETLWSVRETDKERLIDFTLIQRSMDFAVTSSINPAQYLMLCMMVANHLTYKTGVKHKVSKFLHLVQNCHIYDRHIETAKELLERESTNIQPTIELICEPKDFYSHTFEDFKFTGLEGIKPLKEKLEIAI
jgi:thymidylate synthase